MAGMQTKIYACTYTLVLCDNKVLCAFGSDDWLGLYCPYQPLQYYSSYATWAPIDWKAPKVAASNGVKE